MRKDGRGRHARSVSPYHRTLHEAAYARAKAMHDMLQTGATLDEVAKAFEVSRDAVWHAMKRQGFKS